MGWWSNLTHIFQRGRYTTNQSWHAQVLFSYMNKSNIFVFALRLFCYVYARWVPWKLPWVQWGMVQNWVAIWYTGHILVLHISYIYIHTHYNDRYINQQIYVCIIMHTFCKFKLHNYGQSTLRTQWAMASSSRTQSYPPITRSTYIMSGNCNYDIYIYI